MLDKSWVRLVELRAGTLFEQSDGYRFVRGSAHENRRYCCMDLQYGHLHYIPDNELVQELPAPSNDLTFTVGEKVVVLEGTVTQVATNDGLLAIRFKEGHSDIYVPIQNVRRKNY